MIWRPWWLRRGDRDGGHAAPSVERDAAEIFGKLQLLTSQLERHVTRREQQADRDNGDGGGRR